MDVVVNKSFEDGISLLAALKCTTESGVVNALVRQGLRMAFSEPDSLDEALAARREQVVRQLGLSHDHH